MYQLTDMELNEVTGGVALDPPFAPIDPPAFYEPI